ncbi:MAG: DUF2079 domain-containing protein [Candidatus Omnitrophica bacterium]|nr:DUF2079 domain-containing protein [Candidatus Omnitrophota bacterium]
MIGALDIVLVLGFLFFFLPNLSDRALLAFLCSAVFLFFSAFGIVRHISLCSGGWDLGIFDQAIWNVTKGNSLFCTIKYSQGGTLLGDHFEPILFLIAPLYFLWPHVELLLVLQAFLLASAIVPLYLIANPVFKDRLVVFAFLICYVLSKPLRGIAFFDFYPESFMVPALFWGYYFLMKRRDAFLWASIIILLLCKEDAAFLVFGMGLFALGIQKRRGLGISLTALSVFLWWLETAIIIPYFSPTHKYAYLGNLPFGATYLDNFKFCLFHPLLFFKFLFTTHKVNYLLRMLGPLCFLSLLSPQFILAFLPLFKNLLGSDSSSFIGINEHYVAEAVPFIFIAAIYGGHWLLKRLKFKGSNVILSLFLIGSTVLFIGKSDGRRLSEYFTDINKNHTLDKIKALGLVPPGASVLASNDICPHLSHRKFIYEWGQTEGKEIFPDYIVIDKDIGGGKLTPEENTKINIYLNDAKSRGYKTIADIQDGRFLILSAVPLKIYSSSIK